MRLQRGPPLWHDAFMIALSPSSEPATEADIDELAQATKLAFDRIEATMATKDELKQLEISLTGRLDRLDDRTSRLEGQVGQLQRGLASVLDIVTESNQVLKELRDLPARVDRLEQSVFQLN